MGEQLAREQVVAHHHWMSVGLGFTKIPKIAGHMAYLLKKGMFTFKTHGLEENYRPQFRYGSGIMKHKVVFGLQVSVRVEL